MAARNQVASDESFIPWDKSAIEQSLVRRFEQQVERFGGRVALRGPRGQVTYDELEKTANRVARSLLAADPATGTRVVLLMDHDTPLVAAILGVLKAGKICVPLPGSHSEAVLAGWVEHADASILMADANHAALAGAIAGDRCRIIRIDQLNEKFSESRPALELPPEAPAFLIYTSGSSGRPKAVLQNHRNVLHQVRGYAQALRITAQDRICLLASCSSGQGITTTFCALLNGATLCLRDLTRHELTGLADWLDEEGVTILISAASVLRHLVRTLTGQGNLRQLRLVKVGAEAVSPIDVARFWECIHPGCVLMHTLSSTETGTMTQHFIHRHDSLPAERVPAGRAVEDKTIQIQDENGKEFPPGEIGEIVVQSRYLSPGYWRDPERTSLVFRSLPAAEERIYRTGDLGRINADGTLEHLGRKDALVNVRGLQVDPSAIEAVLLKLPGVGQAAVVCLHRPDHDVLVAACVQLVEPECGVDDLRRKLLRLLPAHMVPQQIVVFAKLPVSPNGKPDRQRLLSELGTLSEASRVHPRTTLERRIAAVWSQALRCPVGVYDNFFAIGGDSLKAVGLMLGLSKELGQDLPAGLLSHRPTIAQLAEDVELGIIRTVREPWFRPWQVSLLTLRATGQGPPLVFIPGGYTSENELLVCAGLLPQLDPEFQVFGVRLNLRARRVLRPWTLRRIARRIGAAILSENFSRLPVIIGECHACGLALETAQWLASRLPAAPRVVLLDPWQPRLTPRNTERHSPAIEHYYRLLQNHEPKPYRGETHIVCAADSLRIRVCLDWWSARVGAGCHGHEVPGTHESYIREHRKTLATRLSVICNRPS